MADWGRWLDAVETEGVHLIVLSHPLRVGP
jgi:hypothetical protein